MTKKRRGPGPGGVIAVTAAAFAAVLIGLALQLRAGGDPAVGPGRAPVVAAAVEPRRILVRRVVVKRVIVRVIAAKNGPPTVARASAPAAAPSSGAPAAAPRSSAPAAAPRVTRSPPAVTRPAPAPTPAPAPAPVTRSS